MFVQQPNDEVSVIEEFKQTKDNEKLKQKAVDQYTIREGSPVDVRWAVRWVGEDLWFEAFVEQVCFESGVEESGND